VTVTSARADLNQNCLLLNKQLVITGIQVQPASPGASAGHRPSRSPMPRPAFPSKLHQQPQHGPTTTCPRRTGRFPGWPTTSTNAAGPSVGRAWHPVDLPRGYHTASPGQSYTSPSPVASRAAPGVPYGRAHCQRDATRLPAFKIITSCWASSITMVDRSRSGRLQVGRR
jgi:hypothetical protein